MTATMAATTRGLTRHERLAVEAREAAQLRALMIDPDVVALRVEKVRNQVDALLAGAIYIALAFTMSNVQAFAAQGAEPWSIPWWSAWLLDPIPSLALLAILRAEKVTARYQVTLPVWAKRTKWLAFSSTYVMNTWTSWGLGDQPLSWSSVVLHSVPPLVMLFAAETGPGLRDRLTEAVHRALIHAQDASITASHVARATGERDSADRDSTGAELVSAGDVCAAAVFAQDGEAVGTAHADLGERSVDLDANLAEPMPSELQAAQSESGASSLEVDGKRSAARSRVSLISTQARGVDARVRQTKERLANGEAHTGESVGELFGVSPRTGRRILRAAEADLDEQHTVGGG